MTTPNTTYSGMPPNIVPGLVPGATNSSPGAQAAAAQAIQLAKINSLKALTGGDAGIPVSPLSSSLKGPAGDQLQSTYIKNVELSGKQISLGAHDNAALVKTGGKRRTHKRRTQRRKTHRRRRHRIRSRRSK